MTENIERTTETLIRRLRNGFGMARGRNAQLFGFQSVSIEAANELERVYDAIRALQKRCCGNGDKCNGCRALIDILPNGEKL